MRIQKIVCLFVTVLGAHMSAYTDIYSFHELCEYITPGTMIALDIDNTLMVPHEYEGSDMWFVLAVKEHVDAGKPHAEALATVLPDYFQLQKSITVRSVEEVIPEYIGQWQDAGHTVIGLTNRGGPVIGDTLRLLDTLSIDFSRTAPEDLFDGEFLIDGKKVEYRAGVIFCTTADKGRSLVTFFRLTALPQKIIYVDDTLAKVVSVERALTELHKEVPNLEFHCFHYTRLHEYIDWCAKKFSARPA